MYILTTKGYWPKSFAYQPRTVSRALYALLIQRSLVQFPVRLTNNYCSKILFHFYSESFSVNFEGLDRLLLETLIYFNHRNSPNPNNPKVHPLHCGLRGYEMFRA